MSLVRNFTRRARAHTRGEEIPRSCSVKYQPGTIQRSKISMPTELLSTTNVQALNAPNIRRISADSPDSSSESLHSDDLSIDKFNSSVSDLSPITPSTPFADSINEKDFFLSKPLISSAAPVTTESQPILPKRAPSHSKHAHEMVSRENTFKRSMSPPPMAIEQVSKPVERESHPFGRELAKVAEVAESFAVRPVLDEEEEEMITKGLHKFSVDDYLAEITGLSGGVYEDQIMLNPWL